MGGGVPAVAPDADPVRATPGAGWTSAALPDLGGRHFLVTGGTRGIGLAVARRLASSGARVTITGRDRHTTAEVASGLAGAFPVGAVGLDLGALASVRAAAQEVVEAGPLDVVVANAGVVARGYRRTADGFEMQVGVNFLGHFALVGLLLPHLLQGSAPRVVAVSSLASHAGRLGPRWLNAPGPGREATRAYPSSKLALLTWSQELARRSAAAGTGLLSVAAHPGYVDTELLLQGERASGRAFMRFAGKVAGLRPEQGAEPVLAAATVDGLEGGDYLGPRLGGFRGTPGRAWLGGVPQDPEQGHKLWDWAEHMTGVQVPAPFRENPGE